jgi:hypothetical protein
MHTRSRVLLHIEQALTEEPREALVALRRLLDEDIPWIERTVIRRARAHGYDWARVGRLLRRSRQAVRKRYGRFDATYESIDFDQSHASADPTAEYWRELAAIKRQERFEEWAASDDVVGW